MTKEELAQLLNGCEYGSEITTEQEQLAKDNNLVVVFGASDDLIEFRGFFYDEFGCSENMNIWFNKDLSAIGLKTRICLDSDNHKDLLYFQSDIFLDLNNNIKAIWCDKTLNCSWSYKTDILHSTFDVMEDGELYCKGIIFSLGDLA